MKTVRILAGILAAVMLLSLAGCGVSRSSDKDKDNASDTATGSETKDSETTDKSDGEAAGYKFPAGAESEYALYETVLSFLNGGFQYSELQEIYDPILSTVFFMKRDVEPEDNFTLGMPYPEACSLVVKLREKWSKIEGMLGRYEDFDQFCDAFRSEFPGYMPEGKIDREEGIDEILYTLFQDEFPARMQAQIGADRGKFKAFLDDYVLHSFVFQKRDGESPFGSDQTSWEKKSKDAMEITEEKYGDRDADLKANFPQTYFIDLGEYRDENSLFLMDIRYTKIDGRYYFIGFSTTVI